MRILTLRRAALILGAATLACSLSSCGGGGSSGALPTVSGAFGTTPKITFPGSSAPTTLKTKVLKQGTGAVVKSGQLLVANYVGQIWGGKVFDSSFARHLASSFPIGLGKVIPGWDDTLVGEHAGTRLLLVVPPVDGYGPTGNPQAGITGKDTLVFVIDVIASYSEGAVSHPSGSINTSVDGIGVIWQPKGPPNLELGASASFPKKKPAVTILSKGKGHKVRPGLVVLEYVVINGKTGALLQSTWKNALPDAEPVGDPAAPSILDEFKGIPIGSRVLLRIPKTKSGGPYVLAVNIVAEPGFLT